jgi:Tfp pilus assembly protein PilF
MAIVTSRGIVLTALFVAASFACGCHRNDSGTTQNGQATGTAKGAAPASQAAVLDAQHKYDQSAAKWKEALQADPNNREWLDGLAFSYSHSKHLSEARAIWTKLAVGTDEISARAKKMLVKTEQQAKEGL